MCTTDPGDLLLVPSPLCCPQPHVCGRGSCDLGQRCRQRRRSSPGRSSGGLMNGPQITVVGHVGAKPKLRVLASGAVVADFRVAFTPSRQDKATGVWNDLETMWFTVSCWRNLGEHATMSFDKGDRVIVTGRLSIRSYKTEQGEARVSLEIDASSVGMDLTRGPVVQRRVERVQPASTVEETVPQP